MTKIPSKPRILTTTVGSYPVPDWLAALPSEQAVIDATRVVFDLQRQAGIDLPTDGELYRFDVNHPDTNGMIEYFIRPMAGISSVVGRSVTEEFSSHHPMGFRRKPAGVVTGKLGEGSLNLLADCQRAAAVAGGPFKFTVTSPYMLARTLLDHHYGNFDKLTMALGEVLAAQMPGLPAPCIIMAATEEARRRGIVALADPWTLYNSGTFMGQRRRRSHPTEPAPGRAGRAVGADTTRSAGRACGCCGSPPRRRRAPGTPPECNSVCVCVLGGGGRRRYPGQLRTRRIAEGGARGGGRGSAPPYSS